MIYITLAAAGFLAGYLYRRFSEKGETVNWKARRRQALKHAKGYERKWA